jgi:hypothetical protein
MHVPKTILKSILNEAGDKLFSDANPRIIVLAPLPCYVVEKCCGDPDHIENPGDSDFEQNLETLDELLISWAQNVNVVGPKFSVSGW